MANEPSAMNPSQSTAIKTKLVERYKVGAEEIKLEAYRGWDDERLGLYRARLPIHDIGNPSIALMPSGSFIFSFDDRAFERLVREVFHGFDAGNPVGMALLASRFGNFEAPIGVLWMSEVQTLEPKPTTIPRKTVTPVIRQDGTAQVLEFYSFDGDRMFLYDCHARWDGTSLTLKATKLN